MNAKQTEPQTETTTPVTKAKTAARKGTRGATKPAATKAPRAPKAATAETKGKAREGTKQAVLVEMVKRADGATIEEMMKATGWLSHTVRGALAGSLKKRLSLEISSEKVEGRGRVYRTP